MAKVDSVTIDSREPDAFDVLFEADDDVRNVNRQQIPVGDFLVRADKEEPAIVFERKTPEDYISSIKNNRLETQIHSMYDEFGSERSFLLIEGDMQDFDFINWSSFSSAAARGFTASISARWQCIPLFCTEKHKLADMAVRISRKIVEEPSHDVRDPDNTPTKKSTSFHERAMLQLDGVGPSTIESLQETFEKPLFDVLHHDAEELAEKVDGVGQKRAESIINQVGGYE